MLKMLTSASTAWDSEPSVRENGTVANETHHPLFVDHFREFVEKKLAESFDSLNDVVRSKYMARFFAEKVLAPRNPIIPTVEEDVVACIVDGTNDQGVDFICREGWRRSHHSSQIQWWRAKGSKASPGRGGRL
jgi:hypothetical protein